MNITEQEKEAKRQIKLRHFEGLFVAHCRLTRSTFSFDTWRRAFRDSEKDSDLLKWTRQQAIEFVEKQNALTASPTPQMVAAEAA